MGMSDDPDLQHVLDEPEIEPAAEDLRAIVGRARSRGARLGSLVAVIVLGAGFLGGFLIADHHGAETTSIAHTAALGSAPGRSNPAAAGSGGPSGGAPQPATAASTTTVPKTGSMSGPPAVGPIVGAPAERYSLLAVRTTAAGITIRDFALDPTSTAPLYSAEVSTDRMVGTVFYETAFAIGTGPVPGSSGSSGSSGGGSASGNAAGSAPGTASSPPGASATTVPQTTVPQTTVPQTTVPQVNPAAPPTLAPQVVPRAGGPQAALVGVAEGDPISVVNVTPTAGVARLTWTVGHATDTVAAGSRRFVTLAVAVAANATTGTLTLTSASGAVLSTTTLSLGAPSGGLIAPIPATGTSPNTVNGGGVNVPAVTS